MTLRNLLQEFRELGPGGVAFRVGWELQQRTRLTQILEGRDTAVSSASMPDVETVVRMLPFGGAAVAGTMGDGIRAGDLTSLKNRAEKAARGTVRMFGNWDGRFGSPPDWHLNPLSGERWPEQRHWSVVLRDERRVGDVKLTWELGRFPQAYEMARAAVFAPERREDFARALAEQIRGFVAGNPYARGVHWASGQEIVFRQMAWLFALGVFGPASPVGEVWPEIAHHLYEGAVHIERHLDYTRKAVYNNHLLSEALGLLIAGTLLQRASRAARWRSKGEAILTAQAQRQFYADGGYIQLSHNYERVALQVFLYAITIRRGAAASIPGAWQEALARGCDFLHANQNPSDGRLPNYGANDGALPAILSTCDYADFRPTLQAAFIASHGERRYPPGPWDEEASWLLGTGALAAPLRERPRKSVSLGATGFHVLRGRAEGSFGVFRCGTIRDRFSQIDMLHLDVWWRGQNVLVDGGSYLYNGPREWHEHFMTTVSHNTVMLDGRDQMLHYRRFKNLYWTEAKLLRFEDHADFALAEGEHYGYRRHPGRCVHRRSILFAKDDLWVLADRVEGVGVHSARLQWLCGEYPWNFDPQAGRLSLETPAGQFTTSILDEVGRPIAGDVACGQEEPPRGWLSRYYGQKVQVPSLAVVGAGACPLTFVSVLAGGQPSVIVHDGVWHVSLGTQCASFTLREGSILNVTVSP